MNISRRRWLAPEVVQTSAMDCGPAALKSLLEGFGVSVNYGRLREACQTDIDGTSIDALEEVAVRIGLDAAQRIVPADSLFLPESASFPGLLLVRLPNGLTHFVVAWRVHRLRGRFDDKAWVQIMDPGCGRRWVSLEALRDELYVHALPVPAADWFEHAATPDFAAPLLRRMRALKLEGADALLAASLSTGSWRRVAALDAAVRMTTALARSGAIRAGREAGDLVRSAVDTIDSTADSVDLEGCPVPAQFWSVRPVERGADGSERVLLVGCVVLSVWGLRADAPARLIEATRSSGSRVPAEALGALPPEIAAALLEAPMPPAVHLLRLLREDGALSPVVIVASIVLSTLALLGESLIFRSLFEAARLLGHGPQRLWGLVVVLAFVAASVALELPIATGLLRAGRHIEVRLRIAFLDKIPKLGDRYFSSRPTSDMTERGHSLQQLRVLPALAGQLLRAVTGLAATTAGIAFIAPRVAPMAIAAAVISVALPVVMQRPLVELDLRYRSHAGALGRFYLDALLGLTAVRTHGAERALRREHEGLLVEWAAAAASLIKASIGMEAVEAIAGAGLAAALLLGPFSDAARSGSVLLLAYWALSIPALGVEIAQLARQYPGHRNVALRLLEPLGALEDASAAVTRRDPELRAPRVAFDHVTVLAAGHTVLDDVSFTVDPGSHIAIVGSSGAGKSSLVGVLLGWHTASSGVVSVDGEALDGARLAALRRCTAWVDPAVQIWNASLLDNVRYGAGDGGERELGDVLREAELRGVLERLPDGMQTVLGEGGALVSGGEGQRVRLARAMARGTQRLVILDEPFRGLDRGKRRDLLASARKRWADATLFCVTHDVRETMAFERVLVVEGGRLVEDGVPERLAADGDSRYRALLDAEDSVREGLWSAASWRRLRMEAGRLSEAARRGDS